MNENTQARVSPFMAIIFRLLTYVEMIAIVATAVGFAMLYVGMGGALEILSIALSLLAAVFFLRAYQPLDGPASMLNNENDRPTGMFGLLGSTVGPKVLGIGSAVTVIGILFWLLDMKGAMDMVRIGCVSSAVALLLVGSFIVSKPAWSSTLMPLVYRAVPVWMVGVYVFMGNAFV